MTIIRVTAILQFYGNNPQLQPELVVACRYIRQVSGDSVNYGAEEHENKQPVERSTGCFFLHFSHRRPIILKIYDKDK